jgi:hypothetical protein
MICWVMSSVKVYVVSLWMGICAMAMLLSHQGMGQRRGVVSVQRRTDAGSPYGYACACAPGARGKQSLRQAEERRQSQGLLIDHHTARFHPLDFLREDGRELHSKYLRQLRHRYPDAAAQFGDNEFLRWFIHGRNAP